MSNMNMEEMSENEVATNVVNDEIIALQSEDPAIRKMARKQRLNRRQDAAKRLKSILDGTSSEDAKEKPFLISTIDDSNEKLFQIFVEGKELVTNIRVSTDTREIQRRDDEIAARNSRIQKLEEEASLAMEKLTEITKNWDSMHVSNDPLDLCQELRDQRARCAELIEQKEQLIKGFKEELKLADERFLNDRADMFEDISILAKRIDEQVLVMKRSYYAELGNIENAITVTRNDMLSEQEKEWKRLYEKREVDEVTNLAKQLSTMESNEEEIRRVHVKHDEKYRETKIRLDTDVETLEQELESIKALCLVNSEKLDYNYQVLKKREDENVIIKNNQKRTLNKLQEEVMKLRKKIDEKEYATKEELTRLNKEVCRFQKNIIDIEKKADHFSEVNDRKFQQIWDLKTKEATELLNKILTADKVIHEDILGMDWLAPDLKPFQKEDLVSYQAAVAMIHEVFQTKEDTPLSPSAVAKEKIGERTARQDKILKQILTLIADHSGFLLEEKLEELLEPYSDDERTLVRLDNVFNAIGVQRREEIELVQHYFLPYAACSVCPGKGSSDGNGTKEGKSESTMSRMECDESHPLVIEKTYVLKALREFVSNLHAAKFRERAEMDVRLAKDRCTISRLVSREDVDIYWARFRDIVRTDEEAVWDALYSGLTKYHSILQEREKLKSKALSLKQQNIELRRLVDKYVPQHPRGPSQSERSSTAIPFRHFME